MRIRGISWETFLALANDLNDRDVRLAYDSGDLELMSPSPLHDRYKKLLGRFVEDCLIGLGIPFEPAGESRWIRDAARRGLEADESYFLDPAKLTKIAGRAAERPDDPLPDLAIEIDLSEPRLDRAAIYADLGVVEVWYYDGAMLRIERLGLGGTYHSAGESIYIPIQAQEAADWIARASQTDFLDWLEQVRHWVRNELAARPRPPR